MTQILTELEISLLADKYGYKDPICRDHFMFGAEQVNEHYQKMIKDIQDKVYGDDKIGWIKTHLLKNFSTKELFMIVDFLIARTIK